MHVPGCAEGWGMYAARIQSCVFVGERCTVLLFQLCNCEHVLPTGPILLQTLVNALITASSPGTSASVTARHSGPDTTCVSYRTTRQHL